MTVLEHVLGINWFTYILGFDGSLRHALDINFVDIVRNTNYFLSFQNSLLWEITVVTGQRAYQMYFDASRVRPLRKKSLSFANSLILNLWLCQISAFAKNYVGGVWVEISHESYASIENARPSQWLVSIWNETSDTKHAQIFLNLIDIQRLKLYKLKPFRLCSCSTVPISASSSRIRNC